MDRRAKLFVYIIAALAVAISLGLASGCGNKTKTDQTMVTAPENTPSPGPGQVSVNVYFMRGEEPVAVSRKVEKVGAKEALTEMLKGPTDAEVRQGATTAIPSGTRLNSYEVDGINAKADFSRELRSYGGGSASVQAITGQITETVLSNDPAVKTVEISIDGVPAEEALQP